MIRFEGVSKRFGNGTVAVDDLTLECLSLIHISEPTRPIG